MGSLQRIFYVSRRAPGLGLLDIQRVLWSARIRNRRMDISGALLCSGGLFAQWLEGRTEVIDAVMASIRRDERHTGLRVLQCHAITLRRFGDWHSVFLERPALTRQIEALLQAGDEVPEAAIEALERALPSCEDPDVEPAYPALLQPHRA